MSAVVELVRYTCKDTITVLKVHLSMAIKGKLRGLALCYRTEDGREEVIFTGAYKSRPEYAYRASARMSWAMEQEGGDSRFGPR